MRRFVPALALLLAACPEDPDELLVLRGEVTAPDAVTVLDGVTVKLTRSSDGQCIDELPWHELSTADGGQWRQQLFRGEIQPGFISNDTAGNTRRCVTGRAVFPSGATTDFIVGSFESTTVAPLMFEWPTALALDGGVVSFSPLVSPERLAELDGHQTFYDDGIEHEARVTVDGGPLWLSSDVALDNSNGPGNPEMLAVKRVPVTVPDYVLEDFDAELTMVARAERKLVYPSNSVETSHDMPIEVRHFPPRKLRVKGTRVPLTRGSSCGPLPGLPAPCPLTDGKLDRLSFDGGLNGFELSFPAPSPVELIVVHDVQYGIDFINPQLDVLDDAGTVLRSLAAHLVPTDDLTHFFLYDGRGGFNGPMIPDTRPVMVWQVEDDGGVASARVRVTFGVPVTQASELSLFAP